MPASYDDYSNTNNLRRYEYSMKKQTIRLLGVAMALVMSASSLIGCQGGTTNDTKETQGESTTQKQSETQKQNEEEDSILNPLGTLPIAKELITLTVFAPANGEFSWEDNLFFQELEEKTNIRLEWQTAATGDNVKDKISTMFASKNMPDIILTGVSARNRYDKTTEAMLGAQGLILPLNEYMDTVSVGYKAALDEMEGFREYITAPDGQIYSLPNVDGTLHVQYAMKLWINTHWLDNLGLEMPTTTDEFYEVMKAFKELDANGNGDPNDEIPLSTVTSGAGTQIDGFLMNPFQLTPENKKMYIEDGQVVYSPVQDNYKEGLKFLNKMYEEGILNKESFTQDMDNQVNINEAGEHSVIGAFLAQRPGYACDLSSQPYSTKWQQYQPLPPLKGPDGNVVAPWEPYAMYQTGMTFISSTCSNPEAAFRLIDYIATAEGTMRAAMGIEGVHWNPAEPDELGIDGNPAIYTTTDENKDNQLGNQLVGFVRTRKMVEGLTTNPDPYAEGVVPLAGRQVLLYNGSLDHEKVRQPLDSVLPDLYMSEDQAAEMSLLTTTIQDTQKEAMVQFITGAKDIDSEWDSYIKSLENVGLSRYLEIWQQSYDNSAFK